MVEYLVVLAFGVMVLIMGPGADLRDALRTVVTENYGGYSYGMSLSPLPDYDTQAEYSAALTVAGFDADTVSQLAYDPTEYMKELQTYNDKFNKINDVNKAISDLGQIKDIAGSVFNSVKNWFNI